MAFGEDLDKLVEETGGLLSKHPSWERVRIDDVTEVVNGFAFKSKYFSKNEGDPLVRIRDILSGETGTLYNGPTVEGYDINAGDLLIGMDGDFNSALWKGRKALLNQRVCRVDFKTELYDSRLLWYALPGYLKKINEHTSAVTVKHLSSRTIKNIPLPLPPFAEQKRIVNKIDELFSSIEAGERAIERARVRLVRYRKSILKAAVTGELTRDWREQNPSEETAQALLTRILTARYDSWETLELAKLDAKNKPHPQTEKEWEKFRARYKTPITPFVEHEPNLPKNWIWSSFGQVFDVFTGATPSRKEDHYWEGSIPWVSSGEVSFCKIRRTKECISKEGFNNSSVKLHPIGTILLAMIGEGKTRGQCAILEVEATNNQNAAAIRVSQTPILPMYIFYFLNQRYELSRSEGQGGNQPALNGGKVSKMMFPLPPILEQNEIVSRVEEVLSKANAVEATLKVQTRAAKALKQAVLKTAFEGKLVPQNPNDEPARELLKRIKAAS